MSTQLPAPVGAAYDLDPQFLQRAAELLAVLLDRGSYLVRRPGRHQASDLVDTVARIFLASSIAMVGLGTPALTFRIPRTTHSKASIRNAPMTIRNPTHRLGTPLTST